MAIREDRLNEIERMLEWRPNKTRVPSEIYCGGQRVDQPVSPEFRVCDTCEKPRGDYHSPAPTPIETDDVRLHAWAEYLARWTLTYPCRLVMSVQRQWLGADGDIRAGYHLRIAFHYPDERDSRDGVSPVPGADGRLGLWPPSRLPGEDTPRWIRANVQYHLGHELDEHLLLDGNQAFNPHHDSVHQCEDCSALENLRRAVPELIAALRLAAKP